MAGTLGAARRTFMRAIFWKGALTTAHLPPAQSLPEVPTSRLARGLQGPLVQRSTGAQRREMPGREDPASIRLGDKNY